MGAPAGARPGLGLMEGTKMDLSREEDGYYSPALALAGKARQPKSSTVCESCPGAMWMVSEAEIRCYCNILHRFSWKMDEPIALTECDGRSALLLQVAQAGAGP